MSNENLKSCTTRNSPFEVVTIKRHKDHSQAIVVFQKSGKDLEAACLCVTLDIKEIKAPVVQWYWSLEALWRDMKVDPDYVPISIISYMRDLQLRAFDVMQKFACYVRHTLV